MFWIVSTRDALGKRVKLPVRNPIACIIDDKHRSEFERELRRASFRSHFKLHGRSDLLSDNIKLSHDDVDKMLNFTLEFFPEQEVNAFHNNDMKLEIISARTMRIKVRRDARKWKEKDIEEYRRFLIDEKKNLEEETFGTAHHGSFSKLALQIKKLFNEYEMWKVDNVKIPNLRKINAKMEREIKYVNGVFCSSRRLISLRDDVHPFKEKLVENNWQYVEDVLGHEISHFIDAIYGYVSTEESFVEAYLKERNRIDPYSASKPSEYFATTCWVCRRYPELAEKHIPRTYNWFQQFFDGE